MKIKLQIVETITHHLTVLAIPGEDGFGLLDMSPKERHEQIEVIKHMDMQHHIDNDSTTIDTETEQELKYWELEE